MKENKLRARWSKGEDDLLVIYPRGIGTVCDCNFMLSEVFNREFLNEMESRGYDLKTLKFEIKVDENSDRFEQKFPTLYRLSKEQE